MDPRVIECLTRVRNDRYAIEDLPIISAFVRRTIRQIINITNESSLDDILKMYENARIQLSEILGFSTAPVDSGVGYYPIGSWAYKVLNQFLEDEFELDTLIVKLSNPLLDQKLWR